MRCYPESTSNRNVPLNVFLVAETEAMSGEVHTTYYIDASGTMLKVSDWTSSKAQPVRMFELCRLTLDTERMIEARYKQWREHVV
jgi:hypothetical protein